MLALAGSFSLGQLLAASQDFLVPFWGSDLNPVESTGWRILMQLDQFTQFNNDTLQFPLNRKTGNCDPYCETIGFNTVQVGFTIPWRNRLRVSSGFFSGWPMTV